MSGILKNIALDAFDLYGFLKYFLTPEGVGSAVKLHRLKNKYKDKRCFILGNGPSLNRLDLSLLENEYTFGLNRIYLKFNEIGFETTFLVSVNKHVINQFSEDFNKLENIKFFSWKNRERLKWNSKTHFIRSKYKPGFSKNPIFGVWEGATVTFVAMQLAYYFGFNEVILIGVDHSFKEKGDPHKLVLSKGKDKNHFAPDYFGKGVKWQLPDLETSEYAYKMAKEAFEEDGRGIFDATKGGKLEIFEKIEYEEVFK